nr:uncharacterized protein LOC116424213 isoform X1 [Nomia melanderi]
MASEEYKFFNKRKTSSNVGKQQLETDNAIQVSRSILRGLRYVTNEKNETNQEMEHEIDYEDEWINKLAVIDDEHSRKNGLNERNIEKLLQSLTSKYAHMKPERYCSSQADRVTNCLQNKKSDGVSCANDVERYKTCVDESLRDVVRKDGKYERKKRRKKESFTEAFERKYQISFITESKE